MPTQIPNMDELHIAQHVHKLPYFYIKEQDLPQFTDLLRSEGIDTVIDMDYDSTVQLVHSNDLLIYVSFTNSADLTIAYNRLSTRIAIIPAPIQL